MSNTPWLSIITVTYNSASVIEKLLSSIPKKEHDNIEIIIVDNNSSDNSYNLAQGSANHVIKLDENLGFGTACNRGVSHATTDYLFFVNPDCVIESDTIEQLKVAIANHPTASAFNPRIMQNGKHYFRRRSQLLEKSKHWKGELPNKDCEIPVLSGSSILCTRKLFNQVNGFDENLFLYYEDDDLSLRLKQYGPLISVYNAIIHHSFGYSSGRDPKTAWFKGYHMGKSWKYASKKHSVKFSASNQRIKLILSVLLPHILFNKRRRAKYFGLIKGLGEKTIRP